MTTHKTTAELIAHLRKHTDNDGSMMAMAANRLAEVEAALVTARADAINEAHAILEDAVKRFRAEFKKTGDTSYQDVGAMVQQLANRVFHLKDKQALQHKEPNT